MNYQMISYAWVLFFSALASLLIFASAWHRRSVPGVRPILVMMVATTLWSVANAFEMMAIDLHTKLFWANVQYIPYNLVPLTWFVLALQYTGQGQRITSKRLLLLFAIPILTVIIAFTNPWHGLLRQSVVLDTQGPFPVVGKAYGPWFWVHAAYTYLLMGGAVGILLRARLPIRSLYRGQTVTLLAGLILAFATNITYTLKLFPLKFDITPTVIPIGGLFYLLGLRRFKLFDLLPAAYHFAIRSMGDGIVVLDDLERVVDVNPAAERLIGPVPQIIGQDVTEVFKGKTDFTEICDPSRSESVEVRLQNQGKPGFYEVRCWQITVKGEKPIGRVLLLHDITAAKQARQEVLSQQRLTAVLQERERLARELHDNLGQTLSYLSIQAQTVSKLIDTGQVAAAHSNLDKMITVANETHVDVRTFITETMNTRPQEIDLFVAIQELIHRFEQNSHIVTYYVDNRNECGDCGDPVVAAQSLRIIQEALNNIREHSQAQKVLIEVTETVDRVRIMVHDDGIGFTPMDVDSTCHFGLRIMQGRAAEMGATLDIISSPGAGSKVLLEIPCTFFGHKVQ